MASYFRRKFITVFSDGIHLPPELVNELGICIVAGEVPLQVDVQSDVFGQQVALKNSPEVFQQFGDAFVIFLLEGSLDLTVEIDKLPVFAGKLPD